MPLSAGQKKTWTNSHLRHFHLNIFLIYLTLALCSCNFLIYCERSFIKQRLIQLHDSDFWHMPGQQSVWLPNATKYNHHKMWLHVRWNHYRNTMLLKTFKHIKIQRAINLDALAYWAHAVQQFAYKPQTRTCAHFPKECSNNSTKSKPFSDGDKVSRHDEQSKPQYSALSTRVRMNSRWNCIRSIFGRMAISNCLNWKIKYWICDGNCFSHSTN